jgi:predicted nucleic acid-binding protein
LAQELRADLLIMDEREAREKALRLGVRVTGVCGVILEAKVSGIVPSVKPLLQDLSDRAGFHLSSNVELQILRAAGEA